MALVKSKDIFQRVISIFPGKLNYVFAYGSGVFLQEGQNNLQDNMMDFVFVVDNPLAWHTQNININRSHYSFLRFGGPKLVSSIQDNCGAGVYYNTLIPFETGVIKYGVISTKKLINDLLDWETLYLSGRLHKPVQVVKETTSSQLNKALSINLSSAIYTSLLCLPEQFDEKDLYLRIASLSYQGDFRMLFGEDKGKVQKIVEPQIARFRDLYKPLLTTMPSINWNSSNLIEQDCSVNSRLHYLNLMPRSVQHRLLMKWSKDGRFRDMEDVLRVIAHELDCGKIVTTTINDIVWTSSYTQSLKGILTAGISKSVVYSAKKIFKMIKGSRRKRKSNEEDT